MDLRSRLAHIASSALDLLAPACCSVCRTPLANALDLFCESCESKCDGGGAHTLLDDVPVIAVGHYLPPLSIALRQFKYSGRTDLARPLARRIWAASREHLFFEPAALVPVPLHPKRLADRGYNQSSLLAREIAHLSGFPFLPRALERVRDTPKQAKLDRAERLLNLDRAIASRGRSIDLPVVLVDDVITTGATLKECIGALTARGVTVRGVCVVGLAAT